MAINVKTQDVPSHVYVSFLGFAPIYGFGPYGYDYAYGRAYGHDLAGRNINLIVHAGTEVQSWALPVYFLIFSIIKNDFFAFFIKLIIYLCTSPIFKNPTPKSN